MRLSQGCVSTVLDKPEAVALSSETSIALCTLQEHAESDGSGLPTTSYWQQANPKP